MGVERERVNDLYNTRGSRLAFARCFRPSGDEVGRARQSALATAREARLRILIGACPAAKFTPLRSVLGRIGVAATLTAFFSLPIWGGLGWGQNIGINTTGATPNASAMLDIDADGPTKGGLLIPRLTAAQRDDIEKPDE